MGLQERITYDAGALLQMIESRLDQLKVFQFDGRYRSLLGDAFIRRLADWEKNIRSRKDDPFTLVVCGEFKRGKSSLINALLGEDVVPTNVTTETVTLNRISYGVHSNEAVLTGGRCMRLSDEELRRDSLEALQRQIGEPIRQIQLKRPIPLLKQVTIVDTPGLGDSLNDFSEQVEAALQQADAVVYVFSVSYPLSQGEQLFLKTAILPQKYTDLFLVGNYADMMRNEDELKRIRQMLTERVQGLLPGQRFWLLSALDEQCLQMEEERPNDRLADCLHGNFEEFRGNIDRLTKEKKDTAVPDRMQRMLRGMAEDLADSLTAMEEGLAMSSQEVQQAMETLEKQCERQAGVHQEASGRIDGLVKEMQAETCGWIEELLDRLRKETDTLADIPPAQLIKYYSFYCIDTLQEAMDRCLERHTLELYDQLEEISEELTRNLSRNVQKNRYHFRFSLDNQTWTKGDNVSYVISKLPFNAFIGLVADGIAGTMRQKEMDAKAPDILEKIRKQYASLRQSTLTAVGDTYQKMAEKVKEQLEGYYSGQVDTAKEQMEQSAMVARQDEAKKDEIRAAIAQLREVLSQMEKPLSE